MDTDDRAPGASGAAEPLGDHDGAPATQIPGMATDTSANASAAGVDAAGAESMRTDAVTNDVGHAATAAIGADECGDAGGGDRGPECMHTAQANDVAGAGPGLEAQPDDKAGGRGSSRKRSRSSANGGAVSQEPDEAWRQSRETSTASQQASARGQDPSAEHTETVSAFVQLRL
jgi:hypothetical protein